MSKPTPDPRYAIYFVPGPDTALYRFGAAVLGYDCYPGSDAALIDGVDSSWTDVVREPRVYGFHATLKAPFRLAEGTTETDLERAALSFAADHAAISLGELAVRALGAFIALVPASPGPLLDRFAQACVRDFDRFRAPMTGPERARRLAGGLSARQIDNLEQWGYPHVFEDFRFHMTLTGPLAVPQREQALQFLCDKYTQMLGAQSLILNQIVVARQFGSAERFQVISRAALSHSLERPLAHPS